MNRLPAILGLRAAALLLAAGLWHVPTAAAQRSGDGFLFREPAVTLTLRGGFDHAFAGGDVFSFTREQLTLGRGDFSGPTVGADLAFRLSPRLALTASGAYSGATAESEFRHLVDQDDLPIEQTTRFQRVPLTAGLRAYLAPRGRSVGSYAWIPARYVPYVGANAGAMWHRFQQRGDFVDFETQEIFGDVLETYGWSATAQALAGMEVSLSPRLALTGETRYSWAGTKPGTEFQGFDRLDLSGLSASAGISIRF